MSPEAVRKWFGVEMIEVSSAEKAVSALGGFLSIFVLVFLSMKALPESGAGAVIASMGASAVLLFAAPHGPLSQPWPVIAGHGLSAAVGVVCARLIPHPTLAAACAVGLSIGFMHQLKCIHPPGGATAFTAAAGGSAIHDMGFQFVLVPVLANAVAMVLLAVLINAAFRWRRYPAILNRPATSSVKPRHPDAPPISHEEVVKAVRSLDSFVDISEEDLVRLTGLLCRRPGETREKK